MRRTLTAAVLAAMLTLTACGGGGNDDEEASKAISDAIMKSQEEQDASMISVPQEDADCIGDGLVEEIGGDQLKEYGLLTEDNKTDGDLASVKMSEADATSAADVLTDCTDIVAMMEGGMGAQLESLPKEAQDCMKDALSEDALHEVFVAVFQGDDQAAQEVLFQPMQECATKGLQ